MVPRERSCLFSLLIVILSAFILSTAHGDSDIDDCNPDPCMNGGLCTDVGNGYTCDCTGTGYEGTNCTFDFDDCNPDPCMNGGTCTDRVNGYTCDCTGTGYEGTNCDEDIDDCNPDPCMNGGLCADEVNGYTCDCTGTGYEGINCDEDIDDCDPNPCVNGLCTDEVNGYTCDCTGTGYEGTNCDEDINECNLMGPSYPCDATNGMCTNNDGSFMCSCNPGYELRQSDMKTCDDINECDLTGDDFPCDATNGMCTNNDGSFICTCNPGYELRHSDMKTCDDINECDSTPCLNDGACINLINGYACTCEAAYTGINCQIDINECVSDPCLNGGACTDMFNSFTCTCVSGYTGLRCEIDFNECVSEPCQNGGDCTDLINAYICTCVPPFTGSYCSDIDDCISDPCLNGGDCADLDRAYTCTCAPGYIGLNCGIDIDECIPDPCLNGGTCTDMINGYTCTCVTGYTGLNCEIDINDCDPDPCKNGGNCTDMVNGYTCTCVAGYTGFDCETASLCHPTRNSDATFSSGTEGDVIFSVERCPINTSLGGSPIGRAVCVNETTLGGLIWNITMNDCGPIRETSEILADITRDGVTNETVIEVLEVVVQVSGMDLDKDDIDNIAFIISRSTALRSGYPMITNLTTTIISDIIDVYEENPSNFEESTEAFTEILKSLETQLDNIDTSDGQPFMALKKNLAVQVSSVRLTDFASGLTISASSTSDDLRDSDIILNSVDNGSDRRQNNIAETRVIIPPGVLNDRADDDGSSSEVRLALTVFRTSSLFSSASIRETNSGQNSFNRSVNSLIVDLAVGVRETTNLREEIVFHFTPLQSGFENPKCNFWDFEDNDWSQRGCRRITSSDDTQEITCSCDHLTNFAVLMDAYAERVVVLRVLSIIGCTISIMCIIITLIIYLSNKNLLKHQSQKIFLCLCGSLLCLYITFLIMTALDSHPDYREVAPVPCGIIAALIHFFTLSSLVWVGVEGVNAYLIVARVFDANIPRFMLTAGLLTWGACSLIVLMIGIVARENYAESDYCFLQRWPAIGGLLIPIAAILLANIIIFGLVVHRLFKSANVGLKRDTTPNSRKAFKERVKNAISLLILFGLTWVTGYLTLINNTSQVIQTLFMVFNSSQGFFIFVLYCAKNPAVRAYWARMCRCGRNSPKDSTTSSNPGRPTNQTSSSNNMHVYSSSTAYFSQVGKEEDPKNPKDDQAVVHDNQAFMYEEIEGVDLADLISKKPGKTSNDQSGVGTVYEEIKEVGAADQAYESPTLEN